VRTRLPLTRLACSSNSHLLLPQKWFLPDGAARPLKTTVAAEVVAAAPRGKDATLQALRRNPYCSVEVLLANPKGGDNSEVPPPPSPLVQITTTDAGRLPVRRSTTHYLLHIQSQLCLEVVSSLFPWGKTGRLTPVNRIGYSLTKAGVTKVGAAACHDHGGCSRA
jgi:hypothetical protein